MPEYYILEQDTQRTDMPVIRKVPGDLDALEFLTGSEKEIAHTPVPIEIKTVNGVVFPDAVTFMLPLFSGKLKTLLDQLGVDNIQYYEVEMIDQETEGKAGMKYWLANIIGLKDCIDEEESVGEYDDYLEEYDWEILVIDPQKTDGLKIFRLSDERMLIIIDETIKNAIESAGLEGIRLRNTRDFDGF